MVPRSQDIALGKRVRAIRQQAGVSQRTLAKRLGIEHYQTVQKWETGQRPLSLGMLANIADACGHRAHINGRERTAYVKALFRMGEPEEPTGWLSPPLRPASAAATAAEPVRYDLWGGPWLGDSMDELLERLNGIEPNLLRKY
jgi:transcriptional regulator with XRE-family HTH domain